MLRRMSDRFERNAKLLARGGGGVELRRVDLGDDGIEYVFFTQEM